MLPQRVVDSADAWWARDFGCEPQDLRPSATHVQVHTGSLSEATGIWVLLVGEHPLISLPARAMATLAQSARSWSRELFEDPEHLVRAVAPFTVEHIVGPAFIGYGTDASLDLSVAAHAFELTSADALAIARLRASCSELEWEHGGSEPERVPTFGARDQDGTLCALAGYETWNDLAHIAVVTAPGQRGRGFGKAVVARAALHALGANLIPQYRTLVANRPSINIARHLGFEPYGTSLYIRLAAEPV